MAYTYALDAVEWIHLSSLAIVLWLACLINVSRLYTMCVRFNSFSIA